MNFVLTGAVEGAVLTLKQMLLTGGVSGIGSILLGDLGDIVIKGEVMSLKKIVIDVVVAGVTGVVFAGIAYGLSKAFAALKLKMINKLEQSGLKPGQTVISKSRVSEIVDNYDPLKASSSIYRDSTGRYIVEGHHTTVATTILGKGSGINMNMPTNQVPSATNVHWVKRWYELWKTSIKVVD
ncbi:hypothetical protein SAMN02746066_04627 [Anaerosporobacter mobilis DSM 15930]|jgi:uncharacterized protein (DUF697 family)|uniref:Uncharacterized protein n=1 Tax=Anaerosporobacter mobilis DSM 15930 TaxID=1120996 RepID=A0A1M7NPS6_9FIRM|nr:hypothetical protein [Anaerosporobacter mobilis]SHN05360.1 hypothetical protein SAMN02746066_04627 [Anaerosporobacter mobilis DSM 15930]